MPAPALDAFQVIADPSRRQILKLLTKDSLNISSLAESFEMSRPAVSKHIKILEYSGFISIHEVGRERYCTLNQDGFKELQSWINHFDKFWPANIKKLQTILNNKIK